MKRSEKPFRQMQGVSALLGDEIDGEKSPNSQMVIPLSIIKLPELQPRRYFDVDKIEQLASSIKEHGVLEPLLVRPLGNDIYELVAGERRYRAAQSIKLPDVPVVVLNLNDVEALQVALIENIQREDLNPLEETEAILQLLSLRLSSIGPDELIPLLNRMRKEVNGKTSTLKVSDEIQQIVETVFQQVGIAWESFVVNRLPLLNLPDDILAMLRQGRLEYTKAQTIARVKNQELRKAILDAAVTQDLSLSQIKEKILESNSNGSSRVINPTLKQQFSNIYRSISSSKVWDDPKKQKKLERLLNELKSLLDQDK